MVIYLKTLLWNTSFIIHLNNLLWNTNLLSIVKCDVFGKFKSLHTLGIGGGWQWRKHVNVNFPPKNKTPPISSIDRLYSSGLLLNFWCLFLLNLSLNGSHKMCSFEGETSNVLHRQGKYFFWTK